MSVTDLNLTRYEARLLKKLCKKGALHIDESSAEALMDKGLICYKEQPSVNSLLRPDEKYVLTNDGKLAYEHYSEYHEDLRKASFRSWIAIIISILALILALVNSFHLI